MRIQDPGWKKFDPESGINIPDPQHCIPHNFKNKKGIYLPREI
jgi:hypothetical protein